MTGTAPLVAAAAEPADGRTSDDRAAAAARVFERLTRTIIDAHGRGARRGGKTLVLNDAAGDAGAHGGSTTNVHMADNGRVLKVVALGRQGGGTPGKAPPAANFAEGSVRATVAKVRIAGHADTAAHGVGG